jgi:hypothetical protein
MKELPNQCMFKKDCHRASNKCWAEECYHIMESPQTAEVLASNSTPLLARELCRVHTVAYDKGYLDGGGKEQSTQREIEAIVDAEWKGWLHVAEAIIKQAR